MIDRYTFRVVWSRKYQEYAAPYFELQVVQLVTERSRLPSPRIVPRWRTRC
jgi:hypothetical protein